MGIMVMNELTTHIGSERQLLQQRVLDHRSPLETPLSDPFSFSTDELKDRYFAAYAYNSRTCKYTKNGVYTFKKPLPPTRTWEINQKEDGPGYIHNVSFKGSCKCFILDIDAHKCSVDECIGKVSIIESELQEMGIKYELWVSSLNDSPRTDIKVGDRIYPSNANGFHIIAWSQKPQSSWRVSTALKHHFGWMPYLDIFPGEESFGENKNQNCIRLPFLNKLKKSNSICLKKCEDFLNKSFYSLFSYQLGGEEEGNKQEVSLGKDRVSLDTGKWSSFIENLPAGYDIDQLHDLVKQSALDQGMHFYLFTKNMVAQYYGIEPKTAKSRIAHFRKRIKLEPAVRSYSRNTGHLYATGLSIQSGANMSVTEPNVEVTRNRELGKIVGRMVGQHQPMEIILEAAERHHQLYRKQGNNRTDLSTHLAEAKRWVKSAIRASAA
jgi:hypothetical protein